MIIFDPRGTGYSSKPDHGYTIAQFAKDSLALLLSALMMLEYIGERTSSQRIRAALDGVLGEGRVRTHDLGGQASTTEFTDAVCRRIEGSQRDIVRP